MKVNLGALDRKIEGFLSLDIVPPADIIADLRRRFPFEDSSLDEVLAFDVCEHVGDCQHLDTICRDCYQYRRGSASGCALCGMTPCYVLTPETTSPVWDRECLSPQCAERLRHPIGRIHFLNELHRVLKPGARATVETPNAEHGVGFSQDPTHVSRYCLSTFKYFEDGAFARQRLGSPYGITAKFKVHQLCEIPSSGEDSREQVFKIRAILEAIK